MSDESISKNKADNRMGKTKIEAGDMGSLEALKSTYAEQIEEVKREDAGVKMPNEQFDESLKVDVKAPFVPHFQKITPEEETKINYFFKGITEHEFMTGVLAGEDNTTETGKTKAGTPFKVVVTPSNGTLIITKEMAINVKNANEENGDLEATEMNPDGSLSKVNLIKRHGMIVGMSQGSIAANLSMEEAEKYQYFNNKVRNTDEWTNIEGKGKTPEERLAMMQTLKSLGVDIKSHKRLSDMSLEDLLDAKGAMVQQTKLKEEGKLDKRSFGAVTTKFNVTKDPLTNEMVVSSLGVDMGVDDNTPETIVDARMKGDKESYDIYRRTADGKYICTTDFQIVRGQPKFKLYSLSDINKKTNGRLDDVMEFGAKARSYEAKEIQEISRSAERIREREKEAQREDPNEAYMPGMKRQDPRR